MSSLVSPTYEKPRSDPALQARIAEGVFGFRDLHGSYLIATPTDRDDSGIQSSITLEPGKTATQLVRL